MAFGVKTYDCRTFARASAELAARVVREAGKPDICVGVARGGVYVAEAFKDTGCMMLTARCSRSTTGLKSGIVSRFIGILPRFAADLLRRVESRVYSLRHTGGTGTSHIFTDADMKVLRSFKSPLVAVVDDASDSGSTFMKVKAEILRLCPGAKVVTAAITATRPEGSALTDVSLYRDGTLCRFPWAPDAEAAVRKQFFDSRNG